MTLHVAFLRAINVGKRRVSMDRLRAPFIDLGYEDVSTFIASGNVLFRGDGKPADVEPKIEAALSDVLGFDVVAFVRSAGAIGRIVRAQPLGGDDSVHVGFLKNAATAAARRSLEALATDVDTVTVKGPQIYWLARAGMGQATVSGAALEKAVGGPTTFRSLKMLRRLHDKLP